MAEFDPAVRRGDFSVVRTVSTRWRDNDAYGHLNNVVHYELVDSTLNAWLLDGSPRSVREQAIGVVVESACRYLQELAFPAEVDVAHRVSHLGRSSVKYTFALFAHDTPAEAPPAAVGWWVHVYVSPGTRRPVAIPEPLRDRMRTALV